jgi:polysaccharide pyruvyl transferase WcaK-like protein
MFFGKPLVLLPQTYGPFKSRIAKHTARYILRRSRFIFTRDKDGINYIKSILSERDSTEKLKFVPDVAFILDPRKPEHLAIEPKTNIRGENSTVVGLNISGLLFNGGYTKDNMFGLKTDYHKLIYNLVKMLMESKDTAILLVPHMFPQAVYQVESDPDACLKVYKKLREIYPDRIFIVRGEYDQGEIKYVIGLCDFFIGSRMHSCIAALSQCIPAIGLAYSKKFHGVFGSIGLENCVADARNCDEETVMEKIKSAFKNRDNIQEHLKLVIPGIKSEVLTMFKSSGLRLG